ncbi:hypothetical protein ACFPRL_32885 [Pseudoclavibacter helvolus]
MGAKLLSYLGITRKCPCGRRVSGWEVIHDPLECRWWSVVLGACNSTAMPTFRALGLTPRTRRRSRPVARRSSR